MVQINKLGEPSIDLFANRYTSQLDCYGLPCFAFPLNCIMEKGIVKIQQENGRALIFVAPYMPLALVPVLGTNGENKLPIPPEVLTLHQPHFKRVHPNPDMLCLTVFNIAYPD